MTSSSANEFKCCHGISLETPCLACREIQRANASQWCPHCGSTQGFIPRRHFDSVGGESAWLECETCGGKTNVDELQMQ